MKLADRARQTLLDLSRRRPPPHPRPDGEPLYVLFTIDTEISMGGALNDHSVQPIGPDVRIWGRLDSGTFGIECFMDAFEAHGMRGVFFYEPFAKNIVGEAPLAAAAKAIVDRGHSVELHVHPEFKMNLEAVRAGEMTKPSAHLHSYDAAAQRAYLEEGAADLERWTGVRPIAFRSGGFASDEVATEACAALQIPIDSSYNVWAVANGVSPFSLTPKLNDVAMLDNGVLEVPTTNLFTRGPKRAMRPFELSSLNAAEMIAAVDEMYELGMRVCCTLTHSFRLIRTTNYQYTDARLDWFNLHRLRAFLRHLAAHPDRFRVATFRDLPLERWKATLPPPPAQPQYPSPPAWTAVSRMALQAVKDRGVV
ncbi:MAG: hypothetical protein RMA76_27870 [Deltaproteobacteria bacterium]|jgi:hypothetical protein